MVFFGFTILTSIQMYRTSIPLDEIITNLYNVINRSNSEENEGFFGAFDWKWVLSATTYNTCYGVEIDKK